MFRWLRWKQSRGARCSTLIDICYTRETALRVLTICSSDSVYSQILLGHLRNRYLNWLFDFVHKSIPIIILIKHHSQCPKPWLSSASILGRPPSSAVIYLKVIVVYAFIVSFYVPYNIDYDSKVNVFLSLFLLSTVVLCAAAEMATMAFWFQITTTGHTPVTILFVNSPRTIKLPRHLTNSLVVMTARKAAPL